MASTATNPPPIRACLFDMDGLLLDTEDLYTKCINVVLAKYSRPNLPWSIKAKLQGRPAAEATNIFHSWADLPISNEEYLAEFSALQREHFPSAAPLPGVEKLLADLQRARDGNDDEPTRKVHLALATSSTQVNFKLKSSHLADLFSVFRPEHRVLGDDPRIPKGRGKPLPDIYLVALAALNASLPEAEPEIRPEECLVFEDSVPGVEAGRRAGMQVVWVPHPMLKKEYEGREDEILAGRMGEAGDVADGGKVGEIGDGWGLYLETLENFPYDKYGIQIPSSSS
ncbi:hypothetical protein MCOR25_006325 [Pyricularia grisea]|nr:hypothetical protein MCOR25_006325 [Pyricularia grisea]